MPKEKSLKSVVLLAIVLLGVYSLASAIPQYLISNQSYERSEQGSTADTVVVEKDPINIDLSDYLQTLLESDYLDDLLNNYLDDALNNSGLTPEEFMDLYGDDMENMLSSLSGDSFDPNMFNDFPPELLAAAAGGILLIPMFYTYATNPSNPWSDPESTLFKITSYDEYDTTNYNWKASSTLDLEGNLAYDTGSSDERMWKIKYPITLSSTVKSGIPSVFPSPRIMDYSLSTTPYTPVSGPDLKQQVYLGGSIYEAGFSDSDSGNSVNLTYELLYNSADYPSADTYRTNAVDMDSYTGSDSVVSACKLGPYDGANHITWQEYRANHPYFNQHATALEADPDFQNATNAYEKMEAIIGYVGDNFVWNPQSTSRPADGEDPIEWFCQRQESNYPFEFSSLIVALARLEGLSARYVSGYRWSDALADQIGGGPYSDPDEGGATAYTYRVGNTYTWVEAFIPTSATDGEWVQFDNEFSTNLTSLLNSSSTNETSSFNIKINGQFTPDLNGYDRFTGTNPTQVNLEANFTLLGEPKPGVEINIYDVSYDRSITTITTDSSGIASYVLSLENMESGPHILNFSSSYLGQSFMNATVIDVVAPVNIEIAPITPDPVNTSTNPNREFNVQGYVWDPVLNVPLRNAVINVSTGTYTDTTTLTEVPYTASETETGIANSDSNGNFTITARIPSTIPQTTVTPFVRFDGIFNVSDDVNKFPSEYASYFQSYTIFPQHGLHSPAYTDLKTDTIQLIDYNYYQFSAWINGTNSTSPIAVVPVNRGIDTLFFNATTFRGTSWIDGTIEVRDLSESNRLVALFYTNPSGNGNTSISIPVTSDWTVGPHLLSLIWTDNSPDTVTPTENIWVFVIDDILVDMTTEQYTAGSGGPPSNTYYINVNSKGDPFSMSGYLYDKFTNEQLNNYQIYYRVFNNIWTPQNDTYLEGGVFNEIITANYFSETFYFKGTVPVTAAPIHTDSYFRGEWMNLGNGWDNSWNSLWSANFAVQFNANDTSDYDILLADPEDLTFIASLDLQPFGNYAGFDVIKQAGESVIIGCHFEKQGVPYAGADVYLEDLTNGTTYTTKPEWHTTTDSNGNATFTINFGQDVSPGPHKYKISLTADLGFIVNREDAIWVIYNNSLTISASRTDSPENITRGGTSAAQTISFSGTLLDPNGRGHYYATIQWYLYDEFGVLVSDTVKSNFVCTISYSNDGSFTATLQALSSASIGKYYIRFGFNGSLDIPAALNVDPSTSYQATSIATNTSLLYLFYVYDTPLLTSSYTYEPQDLGGIVPGYTKINITGYLRMSDYVPVQNEYVTIKLYDSSDVLLYSNSTVITDGSGYYEILNLLIESGWNPAYYTVEYGGSTILYLNSASTITINFPA